MDLFNESLDLLFHSIHANVALHTINAFGVFFNNSVSHGDPPGKNLGNVEIICRTTLSSGLFRHFDRFQSIRPVFDSGKYIIIEAHDGV